jgi:hypothetical protein
MASAARAGSDLIGRLARIGSLADDSPDEALKKQTLVLVACTITARRSSGILPGSGATFLLTGMKRVLD